MHMPSEVRVLGYVRLGHEPTKVVSLSPVVTEILYLLGVFNKVVGVSSWCFIPPEVRSRPKVGDYLRVNYELLKELKPDLIITSTGIQLGLAKELIDKGFNVVTVPIPVSVYGVLDNIVMIGSIMGKSLRAMEIASSLSSLINEVMKSKSEEYLNTYVEINVGTSITTGSLTYVNSLLNVIGLRNVLEHRRQSFIKVDDEIINEVKELDPDVIIYEGPLDIEGNLRLWERVVKERSWGSLKAIKSRNLIVLSRNSLSHYGPSLITTTLPKLNEEVANLPRRH
ncbi:MAG: hypothetical protein DRO18_03025 [Thermoprotei archaeon]|nr:MAG: hypothetical protein DRO18_03025 [Thermoprotei archaeon]